MKNFFLRIDLIRKACIVSVVPLVLFTLYTKIAFRFIYIFAPLTVLVALGALFLLPFKRPTDETILGDIANVHQKYLLRIKNENRDVADNSIVMLDGFSPNSKLLFRRIGSQLIAPICRTLVFAKKNDTWEMHVKDTSLIKTSIGEGGLDTKYTFGDDHPIILRFLKYDEKTQSVFLSFEFSEGKIQLITHGKFHVKELCDTIKNGFSLPEETIAFLK